MAQRRQVIAPSYPDPAAPGGMGAVAYAAEKYHPTDNVFSAMAQGFVDARAYNEQEQQAQAKRDAAAEALAGHPDLQRMVRTGIMDVADGVRIGGARDETTKAETKKTAEDKRIDELLRQQGHPDLADAYVNGMIDRPGLYKALNPDPSKAPDSYQTLTEPADRAKYGIPPEDHRTYQVDQTGKLNVLSDGGSSADGQPKTALQPTYGTDKDPNSPTYGQVVLGQLNDAGQFVRTKMPDGVQVMGPGDIAGDRATGTVDAKAAGAARTALPGAEQGYEIAAKAVNDILNTPDGMTGQDENFGNTLGVPNQMTWTRPGSAKANFWTQIDQLSGQAFLQIRQALKGAGQVTDYEGAKGEAALSRMRGAAEKGDQAAFQQAVLDFQSAIDRGMELLRAQAQGKYAEGGDAVANGLPGGLDTAVPPPTTPGAGPGAPAAAAPRIATNPQTGERVQWDPQAGQWVPLK